MSDAHDSPVTDSVRLAASLLIEQGASEVYLFGSRSTGNSRGDSDVDIAVRGLPPEMFFRALGDLLTKVNVRIDVVDLDANDPFSKHLSAHGDLVRVA